MGLGEYIATKSQSSVNRGEFLLEAEHFKYHRDVELVQLRGFLEGVGLEGNLLEAVVAQVGRDDDSLMKMMQAFEFGVGAEEMERSPLIAMWTSGRLFAMGSLPTVIPFFAVQTPFQGLLVSAILVGLTLFFVGAYKTRTTKGQQQRHAALDGGGAAMEGARRLRHLVLASSADTSLIFSAFVDYSTRS
jgi:VIT1/CCC1 family predicted Fe2+/Mn2+ transporter